MMQSFQINIDILNVTILLKIYCSIFSLPPKKAFYHEQESKMKCKKSCLVFICQACVNWVQKPSVRGIGSSDCWGGVAVYTTVPLDGILVPYYNLYKGHIQKLMVRVFSWAPFLISGEMRTLGCVHTISKFDLMAQPAKQSTSMWEQMRCPKEVMKLLLLQKYVAGQVGPKLSMKHQWVMC